MVERFGYFCNVRKKKMINVRRRNVYQQNPTRFKNARQFGTCFKVVFNVFKSIYA